jgi:serine/threonine-protein kinase
MARDGTDPVAAMDAAVAALEGESDGSEWLGQVIDGRYQLDSLIGRGGMGLVYRAQHVGLRRQVAVKILHPSLLASSDVRNRFEREGYAVGRIKHPNCVEVYDRGKLPDGSLYLAMELLEGRSLAQILEQEGQLAPGRALHILAHILRGLSHVHEAGLIHRDIKPENIYLIRQGSDEDFAKILDFGIAKPMEKTSLDDGVKLTQAGMAFGTPIYMAPEQALGNPLDGRADLYAAAVLAYEMLAGQPPFYSDDKLEVMSMHTAKPVPAMRTRLVKGGRPPPSSIERLVVKGLTKKPSDRYADAHVFLAAVEKALKTPDGGVTDVQFDRVDTTGSQPLVSDDGMVALSGEVAAEDISNAIDDVLSSPAVPIPAIAPPRNPTRPAPTAGAQTPPRGLAGTLAAEHRSPPLGSGIGIGLPHTGPQGEPIFGLTPEQRLGMVPPPSTVAPSGPDMSMASRLEPEPPRVKLKKRWPLYLAGTVIAVGIGVVVAVVTTGGDDGPAEGSTVAQAAALLKDGKPDKALALLVEHQDELGDDPQGQLVLGHAYAIKNEPVPAIAAYTQAIALDASLEGNEQLRRSLFAMTTSKKLEVTSSAYDLWARTTDPEARTALATLAVDRDVKRRKLARTMIDKYQLDVKVDMVVAYSLDLEQAPTCTERKQAVSRLRSLDDPRAIPALERAVVRKGKTGTKQSINECLLDDARAAIGFLKGRPQKK